MEICKGLERTVEGGGVIDFDLFILVILSQYMIGYLKVSHLEHSFKTVQGQIMLSFIHVHMN